MRMRLKKHLEERLADCSSVLIAREPKNYFDLTDSQRRHLCVDVKWVFQNEHPLVLEIGCGKGAWAIESARRHPELNYIAVEKLSNVIVAACEDAQKANLPNLRFLNVRAENLWDYLPPKSVSAIVLNFSCPYPKKSQANRRLTNVPFLKMYKSLLVEWGTLSLKTDNEDFFMWSMVLTSSYGFDVTEATFDLPDTGDNIVTEYEAKFRARHKPIYALTVRCHK